MAKFLNKEKAVYELKDLILQAKESLILISPYLKLSYDFKELLRDRNAQGKPVTIIFGKHALSKEELTFFQSLKGVTLKFNLHLHAKCYVNDSKIIITSLNLYDFSIANNKEMGILLSKSDPEDKGAFNETMADVDFISRNSMPFSEYGAVAKPVTESFFETKKSAPKNIKADQHYGYCIRTGVKIPFDHLHPLSPDAYKKWNMYGVKEFAENYCHFSGEPSHGETSYQFPILNKYWKKAQKMYDL